MIHTDTSMSSATSVLEMLLVQTMRAIRIAVGVLVFLSAALLLVPANRTFPMFLLLVATVVEIGAAELSLWLVRRKRVRQAAMAYIMITLVLIVLVSVVLSAPAFFGVTTALMVVMGALLIGPRAVLPPGISSIALTGLLAFAEQRGWLTDLQLQGTPGLVITLQLAFVIVGFIVLMVFSALVSDRLRASVLAVEERAAEAERAWHKQTVVAEQLTAHVAEQERLIAVIHDLEVPLVPILPGVVVVPLVSHLGAGRMATIERRVLHFVAATRTTFVLVDITAVPQLDAAGVTAIIRLGQALRLLGTQMVLTGITAATAQNLVHFQMDAAMMPTYATIEDALSRMVDVRQQVRPIAH